MEKPDLEQRKEGALSAYLSPAGAWAFSIGTSIGWGSFVITSNLYLSQAGPLGSALGLVVGAAVMLFIARNYHYLMNRHPDAGGAYSYAKSAFGYDHGFLVAWFLALVYFAMFWANSTSLPLFGRYFLGSTFHFGYLYSIFGYEVYLGEILLTLAAVLLVGLLCAKSKRAAGALMVVLALVFVASILVCFAAALLGIDLGAGSLDPLFLPDGDALAQVVRIACVSPWAFIGFESISHSTEEFSFGRSKSFAVLVVAVASTTLLYICVTLLSVTAYPAEYASWLDYIGDLGNLDGIKALPAFYAADFYLGSAGVTMLTLALLALIVTSLIGNMVALSRLFVGLARDSVLPGRFASLSDKGIPQRAVGVIVAVSLLMPFLGRTAIGWIVDVTTIGATLIYGFVSASALREARKEGSKPEMVTGVVGLAAMVVFGLLLVLPSFISAGSMAAESYILFTVWAVLGFLYFRIILQRDPDRRFGKSLVVWIALLTLILFSSMIWMTQVDYEEASKVFSETQQYYAGEADEQDYALGEDAFIARELDEMRLAKMGTTVLVMGLLALSFGMMLSNYTFMSRREEESRSQLASARTAAYTDSMTGVKSKRAYVDWEDRMNERIVQEPDLQFALVVCDVNGLKHVNDTLGHKAGDEYIRSASSLVCHLYQHSPVFRVGGDEFVVTLEGDDFRDRDDILRRLNEQVEQNLRTGSVVVSAGMAAYRRGDHQTVHALFEEADARMYDRKHFLKSQGAITRE